MLVRLNTNTTSTTDKGDNYPMFVRLKTNTTSSSTTDKGDFVECISCHKHDVLHKLFVVCTCILYV